MKFRLIYSLFAVLQENSNIMKTGITNLLL
jgi:hypothetical protein